MATTRLMPLHVGKGRDISTAIADIIDYVENPQKTDFGKFIYGYECDTRVADAEFLLSKRQYFNQTGRSQGADDVIAYHLRQAFKPGEVTPEEANQIGRELALKLTKGNHAFVVCTHIDKHHVHNHIIINSTTLDCQKKFRNFWGSTWAIRRMNDMLCLEHGLSIVEDPKPSRDHYGTWLGSKKQPSFQEQIRRAIDAALEEKPKDFEELLKKLEAAGMVHKVPSEEGALYQCCPHPQPDHGCILLRCEACGRITHLECIQMEALCRHLETAHHFCMDPRRTILTGRCQHCAQEDAYGTP